MEPVIRITLIEDDKSCQEEFKTIAQQYAKEKQIHLSLDIFSSGEAFLEKYTKDSADVLFFDIELPGLTGLETSKKLREIDEDVIIIFLTKMAQFAINGYEVNALDYMIKPINYYHFALKIDRVLKMKNIRKDDTYLINNGTDCVRLNIKDICYIESQKHYLFIHTEKKTYRVRDKLTNLDTIIQAPYFCFSGKSYLVNFHFIKQVTPTSILIGETLIPLSRSQRKTFMDQFTSYFNEVNSL